MLVLPCSGLSQGSNSAGEASEKNEMPLEYPLIHFSIYVWAEGGITGEDTLTFGVPRIFYDTPDGRSSLVNLYPFRSTPLLPYKGPQPLVFFDISREWGLPPDALPDQKPMMLETRIPKVIAEFPENLDRAMIVVFPSRRNKDGTLQTMILPYETEDVRPGMVRIINGTNRQLAMKFDGNDSEIIRFKPNSSVDFNPAQLTSETFPRVFIYTADEQGRLRLLHTNKLRLIDGNSSLFVIFPDGPRRVRIKSLGNHEQKIFSSN